MLSAASINLPVRLRQMRHYALSDFIRLGHATRLSARRYDSAVSPLFIYSVGLQPIVFLKQRLKYFGSENPHL